MELARYFEKKLGETPLEALNRFRFENPEYADLKATYAGRLDPVAEGEMLFLFGDLVHEKDKYLQHDKIYTAVFALGFSTDTGDLLGIPQNFSIKEFSFEESLANLDEEKIKKLLREIKNLKTQTYPAFSSKTVNGKPLFLHTKEGNEVERPSREIKVYDCTLVEQNNIKTSELLGRIEKICALVNGDFRQKEILESWQKLLSPKNFPENFDQNKALQIPLIKLSLTVSSGTYIRGMAETIEKVLGIPNVLFSLRREEIKK